MTGKEEIKRGTVGTFRGLVDGNVYTGKVILVKKQADNTVILSVKTSNGNKLCIAK